MDRGWRRQGQATFDLIVQVAVVVTESCCRASPNGGAGSSSSGLAARQTQPLEL